MKKFEIIVKKDAKIIGGFNTSDYKKAVDYLQRKKAAGFNVEIKIKY